MSVNKNWCVILKFEDAYVADYPNDHKA
ncbi:hypothetical protein [Acinetobacter kyonggiensis]